jgi:hypothetical protein
MELIGGSFDTADGWRTALENEARDEFETGLTRKQTEK